MAEAKGLPFGLSGGLGDMTARIREGNKTVLYKKPGPYKFDPEKQKNTIVPKKKFSQASWFAGFINKIEILKIIWRIAPLRGTDAYHRIMSYNVNDSHAGQLTVKNIISPHGLKLSVNEASLTDSNIKVNLKITNGYLTDSLRAVVVIYSYNPDGSFKNDCQLSAVNQEITESTDGMEFNFSFELDDNFINDIRRYQKWIMFFTLIRDDGVPEHLLWTSTAAIEGINEFYVPEINCPLILQINGSLCSPCHYQFTKYFAIRENC